MSASGEQRPDADATPLTTDLAGTVALVVYSVTASVSFAALVFSGPAASGLQRGVATFLVASGVITIVLGVRTGFHLAFGVVQDTAAIVLVPAVAVLATQGSDDPARDVFVVLALAAVITGAIIWMVGRAGLGGAARFTPTTVVAGFLAGTGWLLAVGGIEVMIGRGLDIGDVDDLVGPDLARLWIPGLVLGGVIAVVPLVRRLPVITSGVALLTSIAGFHVIVAISSSLDAVEAGGWLVGPFPTTASIDVVDDELAAADWSAIGATSGQIGVVVILSLLGVLLNIGGIQGLTRRRIDLDRELRTVGIANLIIAPIGGLVGYHGVGDSALADRLGVRRRWVPAAVGVGTATVAFVGIGLVGALPRFVAGGLLIGAGFGLLIDWVRELRTTSNRSDRAVGVVILVVMATVGILEGIVVGILAACLFFVIRYSRIDTIRLVSSGDERRSVVERSANDTERLDELAARLAVYELHGSLFFGSVSRVADAIRARLAASSTIERTAPAGTGTGGPPAPPMSVESTPLDVLVIDFTRVTDVDSSAHAVLGELVDDVAAAGAALVVCGLPNRSIASVARATTSGEVTHRADLDAGLEEAENTLLDRHRATTTDGPDRVSDDEGDREASDADDDGSDRGEPYSAELMAWFDQRSVGIGDVVVAEGASSDELVAVISGSVRVTRQDSTGTPIRLRTLRAGALIGEIGFLTGQPRTATVVAETEVALRVLSAEAHERLRAERPDLAIELYDRVLRSTAGRAAAIDASLRQALR